ncbi:MAG: hypothetical protein QNK37_04940 [Acidobacteriota bacterium]|nr:hypothetical protein [Acidobacteriota bacterium]
MYNKLNLASDFSGWLTHVGTTQSLGQRIINLFRSKYKDVDTRFVNQVKELFDKYSSSSYEGSHQIKTFEKDVLKDFGLTYDPSWVITTRSPFDLTSIDTILEHMEDSTNSYFMIRLRESATSGWGHRVGLIKAGGKYYFYDPNVGIYESSSLAGLKASLRDMFSKIPLYKSSSFWSVIPFAG